MSTFTLLLPVYAGNAAEHLREAFESSVHRQSRRPDAVVVTVDGPIGEPLESQLGELVESSPSPVRVVRLPTNQGLASALNAGLAGIETEYVARMDADDISLPERFERQLAEIEARQLDLLGTAIAEFAGRSETVIAKRTPPVGDEIRRRAPWAQPFNHPTVVFRLAAVRAAGGYPTDVGRIEDYVLFARMLVAGARVDNLPETLLLYRVDDGGFDRRGGLRMFGDELRLQRELRRIGLTRRPQYLRNVVVRGSYRLAPTWLRSRVYRAAATSPLVRSPVAWTTVSPEAPEDHSGPRFSVVIPAYNVERYISRGLRSIVRQTLPAHEVLVYDDGSSDGTAAIVAEFAAKHSTVRLIQQQNTGQGAVRNRGAQEATGDYLLFVDGDDELDPRTLERCAAVIEADAPDFVTYRFQARYPFGIRGYESHWTSDIGDRRELTGTDTELLLANRWLAPWQSAYRLAFVRAQRLRNGEGYIFEDQEFTAAAIVAAQRVGLIDAPLYRYHFNASSSLRDKSDAARRRRIDGRRQSRQAMLAELDRHHATPLARALLADHDVHDFMQEIVLGVYTDSEREEVLTDVTGFLNGIVPVDPHELSPVLAEWFAMPASSRTVDSLTDAVRTMVRAERSRIALTPAFRVARGVVRSERHQHHLDELVDEKFARVFRSFPYRMLRRLGTAVSPVTRRVRRSIARPS